ncbi:MAG: hypothetical protein DRG69_07490 [Deltaproteobacteria bacterium]|nr:MAG: hypothetical protein DRG69_07490 [Deltaproteobacteria bacterium]
MKCSKVMQLGIIAMLFFIISCKHNPITEPDEETYDPRNISRTETQSVGPVIALSPDGTVYVIWMDGGESENEPFHIYFKYKSPHNEGWSESEIISDTATNSWEPGVVVDPFGNLHVVWREEDPDVEHAKIYYRMRSSSGEWSDIEVISCEVALQPRIAVDSSGTVHVVWNESRMRYRNRTPDGTWSAIEEGPIYIENPSIAVDSNGGVHLVTEQGAGDDIVYLYRSPTGEWSEPVNVSKSPDWYSWVPSVTVGVDGTVWVNWVEVGQRAMYYAFKRKDGDWTLPDSVPDIPGYPGVNKVLYDKFGNLHYIWEEIRDGACDIYHKVFSRDGDWGDEENLSGTPGYSLCPDFAIGSGGIYVVWSEREEEEGDYNREIYFEVVPLP